MLDPWLGFGSGGGEGKGGDGEGSGGFDLLVETLAEEDGTGCLHEEEFGSCAVGQVLEYEEERRREKAERAESGTSFGAGEDIWMGSAVYASGLTFF